jgi:predicted metalloprotease
MAPSTAKENEFMKWLPGGESQDIEDRRGESGGGGFQFGGMHIGIGGAIVLLILSFIFRTNLFTLLGGGTGDSGTAVSQPDPSRDAAEKPLVQFVSFVLDDTQNTWTQLLPQQTGTPIDTPSWCFSAITLSPDAAAHSPPRVPFIVLRMRRFTLTWAFSMS